MLTAKQARCISEGSEDSFEDIDDDFLDYVIEAIRDSAQCGGYDTLINISKCKDYESFVTKIESLGYYIGGVSYQSEDEEDKKREKILRIVSWEG